MTVSHRSHGLWQLFSFTATRCANPAASIYLSPSAPGQPRMPCSSSASRGTCAIIPQGHFPAPQNELEKIDTKFVHQFLRPSKRRKAGWGIVHKLPRDERSVKQGLPIYRSRTAGRSERVILPTIGFSAEISLAADVMNDMAGHRREANAYCSCFA